MSFSFEIHPLRALSLAGQKMDHFIVVHCPYCTYCIGEKYLILYFIQSKGEL